MTARPARSRARAILLSVLLGALVSSEAAAQGSPPGVITPVCVESCPNALTDPAGYAACAARQQACTAKIDLYKSYMLQLGLGTTHFALPALYVDVLQPLYRGADLRAWRFAFGDRQPANNATTDCGVTYFNHQGTVNDLRNGRLDEDWQFGWLLHELRHFAQCTQLGGRDAYAKMWFGHLEFAFLTTNSADMAVLHDEMFMEADAENVANRLQAAIVPMRDRNGRLVRPIAVTLLANGSAAGAQVSGILGTAVQIQARATGGSTPFDFTWTYRRPGETMLRSGSALLRSADVLELTPDQPGKYEIHVRVGQNGTSLRPATRSVVVQVADPPVVARTATPVTTVRAPVSARTLQPLGTLTVQVYQRSARTRRVTSASGAAVTVGTATQAKQYGSRVTDASGSAVFPGVPLSATQPVTITATATRCRARSMEHAMTESASTVRIEIVC